MKNEEFLKIFGTENPSAEQFRDWVLENDPLTWKKWTPPLKDNEIALLSDPEACQECPWSYHYKNVKTIAVTISQIREAKKSNISNESLLFLLGKLENEKKEFLTPKKKTTIVLFEPIPLLNKYGISIDEVIDSLGQKFQARKKTILQDLSQWTIKNKTIYNLKSQIYIEPYAFSNEKYNFLKKTIIQSKVKDIKNNPQNWEVVRNKSMYGETRIFIKRKDSLEELGGKLFTSQEFAEIEQQLRGEKNYFYVGLIIFLVLATVLFLMFFWWLYRKKSQNI